MFYCPGGIYDQTIVPRISGVAGCKTILYNGITLYATPIIDHARAYQCITGAYNSCKFSQIAILIRIPKAGVTIVITLLGDFTWPTERINPGNFTASLPGSIPAL